MGKPQPLNISIPLTTEVVEKNRVAITGGEYVEGKGVVIHFKVQRLNWRKILKLPKGTKIHWEKMHEEEVQELSSFQLPIFYRVRFGDGWYRDPKTGKKIYFGVNNHLAGIDLKRKVTSTAIRTGVLLAVMTGVGLRYVCWLLQVLFHLTVSKSSLGRWIEEIAKHLPDREGMLKHLLAIKPFEEGHLDELYPKGWGKQFILTVKDEHGRIVYSDQILEKSAEHVVPFLEALKRCGVDIKRFYVDGCKAYRDAIKIVYPDAVIQYDYFHIIQNIWRKLRKALVGYRREIKTRCQRVKSRWYQSKLETLAEALWKKRGLILKNPDNMSEEEKQELLSLMESDRFVSKIRHFAMSVWGIFRDSPSELGAQQRLSNLKKRPEVQQNPNSAFGKSVAFLEDRFEDMIAYLRHPDVKRNSLAESGMRILRRLEQGHDGFRGDKGRDAYFRLYQAIKYCGWLVYRTDGGYCLPAPTEYTAEVNSG